MNVTWDKGHDELSWKSLFWVGSNTNLISFIPIKSITSRHWLCRKLQWMPPPHPTHPPVGSRNSLIDQGYTNFKHSGRTKSLWVWSLFSFRKLLSETNLRTWKSGRRKQDETRSEGAFKMPLVSKRIRDQVNWPLYTQLDTGSNSGARLGPLRAIMQSTSVLAEGFEHLYLANKH